MENGVFKCVGLVQQYASANSKLHGMRDLVSPVDALSLGAETLLGFASLPGHSHSQSIKPVVH
jgi:hypothetical protein